MINNLSLAERKFEEFLPILKENYPEKRKNKAELLKFINAYEDVFFNDNVVTLLYDHRNIRPIFLSNNFERLSGYNKKTIHKWGSLFLFKGIHYSHYSYIYHSIKHDLQFSKNLSKEEILNATAHFCGLKLIDEKGAIRRVFFKGKRLALDEKNQSDISIFFIEDVTHLIKGEHFWIRHYHPSKCKAFVNQKGKKDFKDLVSEREKAVLSLIAEKKSTAEIAEELNLSKLTVQTHRKNMIKRVGAVDSTALVHLCKMANVI